MLDSAAIFSGKTGCAWMITKSTKEGEKEDQK